ncbi:MAG: hypothetical protein HGGPFJEG_02392 [Ignavibacteria bacterium]|nr:hypothetical protein [Ignavibacteria bacterium]
MKRRNVYSFLFFLMILMFFDPVFSQSPRMKDKFYIGYFNLPYELQFTSTGFLNDYKSLSLNAMQGYMTKGADTDPTNLQGGFNDSLDTYKANVQSMLGKFSSTLGESSMLLSREKISRPAYGQQSTYQAEYVRAELVGNIKKPGYGYKHGGGSYYAGETWQGETGISGRYCQTGTHLAQIMVDSLYENLEQVNDVTDNHLTSDRKSMYSDYRWYIKPRMRIPQSFANDPNNWEKIVVIMEIQNFSASINQFETLKVKSFLDENGEYNGRYLEMYRFDGNPNIYPLSIKATDLTQGAVADASGRTENLFDSKVDYRVYWYGEVDVWLDYVRVEDEWAHFLFNPQLETASQPRKYFFNHKILEEVNAFSVNDSGFAYFYMDEYFYNNIPCISEVNRIIKNINTNTGLISVTCEECTKGYWSGLRNLPDDDELYNSLYDKNVNTDIMLVDKYPIYDSEPIPHNLSLPNSGLYPGTIHYQKASNAGVYNQSLNGSLISRNILSQYKNVSNFTKDKNIVFSFAAQIHNFEHPFLNDPGLQDPTLREPTNEEISLQCYLALSYGAKHIFHFAYNSEKKVNLSTGDSLFLWGMLQSNFNDPRYYNYYNQNKWTGMKNHDSSLIKIGKYIYDQNSLVHDDNRTVDVEGLPFKYVSDLKSIYRHPQPPPDNYPSSNEDSTRYWELGFFNSNTSIAPLDKSKYFMAVNKRCTPEDINYNGDLRTLKIKFDSSQLTGFNNWKIIEAKTNTVIRTFDKDSNIYIDMGIFQPGEGKLYKLAPVMQEGGTLVTNEDCGGFEFDCNNEVNNNGKNINIKPGTTINFTNTSARINMDGGDFYTGNTLSETSPVYLRGKNGSFWKGLFLDGCSEVEISTTYFENISPYPIDSTYAIQLIDCEYVSISSSHFTADLDIKTGGILVNYTSELRAKEAYINYNHFQMDTVDMPALSVTTSGYITFPMIVEGNVFESFSGNSLNAIFLSGVAGGAIKENYITGYKNGIILLWAEMDIYGNSIIGSADDSKGILCYASSYTNLSPNGFVYTGGLNSISCEGENSACIESDNSFLYLDYGYNTFDLINYDPGNAFHLTGSVNEELVYEGALDETLNCFMVSETETTAVHNVTYGFSDPPDPVEFNFEPYYCGDEESEGMIVF